jgi:hypothetical protein
VIFYTSFGMKIHDLKPKLDSKLDHPRKPVAGLEKYGGKSLYFGPTLLFF